MLLGGFPLKQRILKGIWLPAASVRTEGCDDGAA
jgi:hypothetical protein